MAHNIDGLIIRVGVMLHLPRSLAIEPAALLQGFRFVPFLLELDTALRDRFGKDDATSLPEFPLIGGTFLAYAHDLSTTTPVALVRTEYFGGFGEQSAALFKQGQMVLGPLREKVDRSETKRAPGPINQVLREMGVRRAEARDEFEALGLHELRDMDRWLC